MEEFQHEFSINVAGLNSIDRKIFLVAFAELIDLQLDSSLSKISRKIRIKSTLFDFNKFRSLGDVFDSIPKITRKRKRFGIENLLDKRSNSLDDLIDFTLKNELDSIQTTIQITGSVGNIITNFVDKSTLVINVELDDEIPENVELDAWFEDSGRRFFKSIAGNIDTQTF